MMHYWQMCVFPLSPPLQSSHLSELLQKEALHAASDLWLGLFFSHKHVILQVPGLLCAPHCSLCFILPCIPFMLLSSFLLPFLLSPALSPRLCGYPIHPDALELVRPPAQPSAPCPEFKPYDFTVQPSTISVFARPST